MICPNCHKEVISQNLNVQTDIGKCQNCYTLFKISEQMNQTSDPAFDMNDIPKGAWLRQEFNGFVLGASTRHLIALFLVPFMVVWSGGSLGGLYGTQIANGEFDLFMTLFSIPFLIGSVVFWSLTLMVIFGKIEITFDKEGGTVFTGIGKIGIKRHFIWKEISSIEEGSYNLQYPGKAGNAIVMKGKKRIRFGMGLNEERKYYLLQTLKKLHSDYKTQAHF